MKVKVHGAILAQARCGGCSKASASSHGEQETGSFAPPM
jgi:hypothetical protein